MKIEIEGIPNFTHGPCAQDIPDLQTPSRYVVGHPDAGLVAIDVAIGHGRGGRALVQKGRIGIGGMAKPL